MFLEGVHWGGHGYGQSTQTLVQYHRAMIPYVSIAGLAGRYARRYGYLVRWYGYGYLVRWYGYGYGYLVRWCRCGYGYLVRWYGYGYGYLVRRYRRGYRHNARGYRYTGWYRLQGALVSLRGRDRR